MKEGRVGWKAPSNIALVKYWGKRSSQIPANTSLSFTLDSSFTETYLSYSAKKSNEDYSIEVWLDGKRETEFESKILTFFDRIVHEMPFIMDCHFKIETKNSFPHSSGIASSASGFAALSLCLCSIEENGTERNSEFYQRASHLARLGSGSAARSVYGGLVMWGRHNEFEYSSDTFATPLQESIHPVFKSFRDTILLVEKGKKEVSSTLGHSLMDSNPFAKKRFKIAQSQIENIVKSIESGNVAAFGKIVEQEALMLHGLMMSSNPYFILMKGNTVNIIHKVWEYRNKNDLQLYITLDAGANVHLLYPEYEEKNVLNFIDNELVAFCKNKQYLCDRVGNGPSELL